MNKFKKIKDMHPEYRPDERFSRYGPEALTSAELLAIIIRSGSSGEPSVELTKRLLYNETGGCEDILNIYRFDYEDLVGIKGIGPVKARQIKAVCELAKRISKSSYAGKYKLNTPEDIAACYMEQLRHRKTETILLLLFNSAMRLIKEIYISEGTANASLFSPRDIYNEALRYGAVNIVLLHNHPGGSAEPSEADIKGTMQIYRAGRIIGIELQDHIIIGDGIYLSLKEQGYMNE